ncbi:ATP-dependent helicase [Deinococcus rubellus]|uniref:ATP-dependent helicase n=1 Tax=Deinococcus rubellus TaxID=1889240 RepID=UPI0031E77F23
MKITSEQQRIIEHTQGHALVFAVAGSGKTTTMIERILYLVRQAQVQPKRILACTFSREAARTIEERLNQHPETQGVISLTLHALAYRVVQEAKRLGLTELHLGEEHFSRKLFNEVRAQLIAADETQRTAYFNIKYDDFATYLSVQKANLRLPYLPSDLPDQAKALISLPDKSVSLYADLYARHDELRRKEGKIDYDDSLVEAWLLMARFPQLQEVMAGRWDYVHVDEFQDVNLAQSEMLDLIASACRSYTAIGDDDQTIYQWRGANPRYILEFAERYAAQKFTLSTNFRCPMGVIALADQVIDRNTVRERKRLQASRLGNGVFLHEHRTGAAAHLAIEKLAEGVTAPDIAILIRTYAQTGELEQVFLEKGVPYLIVGGQPFYQRQEVGVLLAYLRLALADFDVQRGLEIDSERRLTLLKDWRMVANVPNRYLRSQLVEDISKRLWRNGQRLPDVLGDLSRSLRHYELKEVKKLSSALGDLTDSLGMGEGKEPLLDFAEAIGYSQHLIDSAPTREFGEERAGSVRALAEMAQQRSLGELVTYIAHLSQQARHEAKLIRAEGDVPRVVIMTAFRAKGLEFPVVLIPDCKASLYKIRENPDQAAAEEERRVFYVALTRAKQELHLIVDSSEPTPFLTAVSHERLVAAHARLHGLLVRDPAALSARETFEASETLQFYQHQQFIQLWFGEQQRSRLQQRFAALSQLLEQVGPFQGQRETINQLSLERYAHHGQVVLAGDPALLLFPDLPELIREQSERHTPKPVPAKPSGLKDALGRTQGRSGGALSPAEVRIGMTVSHPKCGRGIIVGIENAGESTDVEVRFDTAGVKKLRVIYAFLKALPSG